jgi:branched-chain amino acid transport system substrate-binding protein
MARQDWHCLRKLLEKFIWPFAMFALFTMGHGTLSAADYDVGASDTEIKIGNTNSLTGPLANYGMYIKVAMAYIDKINKEEGGVNNRKIVIISKDDAYDPSKGVEFTRELLEKDKVLFMYLTMGTPTAMAVRNYLNDRKVPQLFIVTGADEFFDPVKLPWSMTIYPRYTSEGKLLARYLEENKPTSKVAVLYANSDYGKSYFNGFKNGLHNKAMIVKELPIDVGEASVQFPIQVLKNSGADTFFSVAAGKLAVPALQMAYDGGWKPSLLLPFGSIIDHNILKKVGLEKIAGALTFDLYKHPGDPRWKDDKAVNEYKAFMQQYLPEVDVNNKLHIQGYFAAQLLVALLKKAGDNLTRENIMNIAKNMDYTSDDFPVLLPGIEIHTSPSDYEMFSTMMIMQFEGNYWNPIKIHSLKQQ